MHYLAESVGVWWSYAAGLAIGIAWNALNIGIALMLLLRARRRPAFA